MSDVVPIFESRLDPDQTRQALAGYDNWYHRFTFRSGGEEIRVEDSQQATGAVWTALSQLGLPEDAGGLRVLDVGCCDGFYSFAMEQRGADVTSIDYRDVMPLGFGVAQRLIGSSLAARVDPVYNVTPDRYGKFDLVLFLGVIYHLRHPLLALDRIRAVMNPGGKLFVESGILPEEQDPVVAFHPRDSHRSNWTNWFQPSDAAVVGWLDTAEFRVEGIRRPQPTRGCYAATAVADRQVAFWRDAEWNPGLR